MIVESHSILHAANGIYIIIHNVIWCNNTYSNTCKNRYNYKYSKVFILILVQICILTCIRIQILI